MGNRFLNSFSMNKPVDQSLKKVRIESLAFFSKCLKKKEEKNEF